jgi:enoyl-CoA hydratase/carnithine racemase
MDFETILYAVDGPVATITLNRPEQLNTIVPPMPDEVEAAVARAVADRAVRVIVLRGAGRSFCAGYDFGGGFKAWDEQITTDGEWDAGRDFAFATAPQSAPTQKLMSVWRAPKPVIAQVHGWCVGGGSDFALCADLVVASEDAQIGTPYSRMWGAYLSGMWIYRLGLTRTKFHALTGRPLSGRAAADGGTRTDPLIPARGHEADRQPGLREHGPRLDPDARPDPRRPDAQHARGAGVDRAGGCGGGAGGGGGARRPVRGLLAGRAAGSSERDRALRVNGLH